MAYFCEILCFESPRNVVINLCMLMNLTKEQNPKKQEPKVYADLLVLCDVLLLQTYSFIHVF